MTMRSHTLRFFLIVSLIVTAVTSASAAENQPAPKVEVGKAPTGLGKAEMGMSPEQAEKIFKDKLKPMGQENLGATPVFSPDIQRQLLIDQKVPEMKDPTKVELRYWKNKLWVIIVYYGQNTNEAVNEGLVKQFGKPSISSTDLVWQFPKLTVNTSNRDRWYAIADTALSREAQAAFAEDLRKAAERRQTQQAPAAAPQQPAPPAGK